MRSLWPHTLAYMTLLLGSACGQAPARDAPRSAAAAAAAITAGSTLGTSVIIRSSGPWADGVAEDAGGERLVYARGVGRCRYDAVS